ncbi:MAG: NADH-quinone oxidoreductase subunit M [Acidimicrobiia bacterium]|nr:NADH-quinone oxidoreductase subunit M [Acidimicrobiia bacterium]
MGDFPVLTALIFTPFLGAVLTALVPSRRPEAARVVGYAATMATAGIAGFLLWNFETGTSGYQFVEEHRWIGDLGVGYVLGVDGISLFMVVLTALLFPLALLGSAALTDRVKQFTVWMLVLEASIMGVFLGLDLILFFVFFELVLVPMYFVIGGWGHDRRVYAAMKFFVFTMAGSAFLLAGILTLAFLHAAQPGNDLTFDLRTLTEWAPGGLASSTARWLFLAFFASFAVKVPLFPLHTWLPDAHTEAPTAGSVILAGVLLKMGTYGFLRFSLGLFPQASVDLAPVLLVLATIGIVYGAIVAAVQPDLKRLVAYSSVAHLGFVVLGVFALTTQGLQGGLFTMISHGLTTGALFLLVGMVYERRHTRQIAELGGLWKAAPVLGGVFLVTALASVGLPGFSGFVGEFLALLGTYLTRGPYAVIAATGVILAAVYLLWAFQRAFTGEPEGENATLPDLGVREVCTVVPLLALSLFLGLYPKPVLDRVEPAVADLIAHVEEHSDYRQPDVAEEGPLATGTEARAGEPARGAGSAGSGDAGEGHE